MFHVRTLSSTALHPQTACGATPEYWSYFPAYAEGWNTELGEDEPQYKPHRELVMTDWDLVKSMPDMSGLCQQCVSKLTIGGRIKINKEEAVYPKDSTEAPF